MVKRVYDTSSLILIWDYYPLLSGLFPQFWAWLLDSFQSGESVIPAAAFKELEIERKGFADLLIAKGVKPVAENDAIQGLSFAIREAVGVGTEGFSSKGASAVDLIVIATAKFLRAEVISEEHQPDSPGKARNSKIPEVCRLNSVKFTNTQGMLAAYVASVQR